MRTSLIVTAATSMTMHKTVGHPIAPSSKAGERRSLGRGWWVSFNVRKGWTGDMEDMLEESRLCAHVGRSAEAVHFSKADTSIKILSEGNGWDEEIGK